MRPWAERRSWATRESVLLTPATVIGPDGVLAARVAPCSSIPASFPRGPSSCGIAIRRDYQAKRAGASHPRRSGPRTRSERPARDPALRLELRDLQRGEQLPLAVPEQVPHVQLLAGPVEVREERPVRVP